MWNADVEDDPQDLADFVLAIAASLVDRVIG